MNLNVLRLLYLYVKHMLIKEFIQGFQARLHKRHYRAVSNAKNIVVLGGSFSGCELVAKLINCVPTGYRVIMIERNSHFNFTFNFPRYSVLQGHEQLAFIPYDGIAQLAPAGMFQHVRGVAEKVDQDAVYLSTGKRIPFAFLAIATGASQPLPARTMATDREDACVELRGLQEKIKAAHRVAIIGGGAVGVELSSDIKSYYPQKDVSLIHSRNQLLPRFGKRLHDHVLAALTRLGVKVLLGERPKVQPLGPASGRTKLRFASGSESEYDLVIQCTGQTPNSGLLSTLAPDARSPETGRLLVKPTLQIQNCPSNVFALGDVAETNGPKMGRAGYFQAEVVRRNIVALVNGKLPTSTYQPLLEVEGAITLSLGRSEAVTYTTFPDGTDMLRPSKHEGDDLRVGTAWARLGADLKSFKRNEKFKSMV